MNDKQVDCKPSPTRQLHRAFYVYICMSYAIHTNLQPPNLETEASLLLIVLVRSQLSTSTTLFGERSSRNMPRKGMRSLFFSSKTSAGQRSTPSSPAHPGSAPNRQLSFSESLMDDNVATASEIIEKWDVAGGGSLFSDGRREARDFLRAVRGLQEAMQFYAARDSSSHKLVRAQRLMESAMRRLQLELRRILAANRDLLDPESVSGLSSNNTTVSSMSEILDADYEYSSDAEVDAAGDSIREVERVSALAMSDLRLIADGMISSGYGKECVDIYKAMRRSIVEEGLYLLGFEKMSGHQVQKLGWELVDHRIKIWLHAVKVAVKTLFSGERILADHVFASSAAVRESCFADITRNAAVDLLAFAEVVATKTKRSPERLFRYLDVYDAVAELWPDIDSIFSYESTAVVRNQAAAAISKLTDTVLATLKDFEAAIQKDSSKSAVPGGGVHPLNRYVMNYLALLACYTVCLADIFADLPPPAATDLQDTLFLEGSSAGSSFSGDNSASSVSARFARFVLALLCKLDRKAEVYKDVGLAYLFLSNNHQYVLSKVHSSDLRHLLGEDWLARHEAKVQLYAANYQRVAWSKVVSALPDADAGAMSPEAAKVVFRRFNAAFDEACRRHSGWVVPHAKLRDQIKLSLAGSVGPKYREFYGKHRAAADGGVVVRFSPEDVANCLSDLFYGDQVPSGAMSDSGSVVSSVRSRR